MKNSYKYLLENISSKEIFEGFNGKFIHTDKATFAFWNIDEGAELPPHSHVHEQTVIVLEGELELILEGSAYRLTKGSVLAIPSNAEHSGHAVCACHVLDVFCPVRKDYVV